MMSKMISYAILSRAPDQQYLPCQEFFAHEHYQGNTEMFGRAIHTEDLQRFEEHLRGELIGPGNDGYESTRRVWNGMIDKQASYGANYERLVALKSTYEPTNVFQINQNIKPTVRKLYHAHLATETAH